MVSWNKSFASAFKIIGFSIGWWIVGISIFFIGLSMIGNQLTSILGSSISGKAPDSANVMIGFILIAIGYIIGMCGTLASFMKVFTELIIEETDESKSNTILNNYDKGLKNFEDDTELKTNKADKLIERLKLVKGQ